MEIPNELERILKETEEVSAWFEYKHGIKVHLKYIEKRQLQDIANRCKRVEFVNHEKIETTNDDLFAKKLCPFILGWKGLSLETLASLIPIKLNGNYDLSTEVPCTEKFKLALILGNYDFDSFLQNSITDLSVMREAQKAEEIKNSETSYNQD